MKTFACVVVFGCMMSAVVRAQSTAQIHGTVQDPSGAAVPAADVKAVQVDTGVARSVVSEADGACVLTNLPLGAYRLEVGKQDFATCIKTGMVLVVGSDAARQSSLKLGRTKEDVNVEANAAL